MKFSRLVLAFLLCSLGSTALAQGVSIGPRVGLNVSTFAVKPYNISTPLGAIAVDEMAADDKFLIAPQAGLMVNIAFDENFSIQPEIMYAGRGRKQGGQVNGQNREHVVKLNYLEVPVLFKASWGLGKTKVSALAGPYFAHLLNGSDSYKEGGETFYSGSLNYDFTDANPSYYYKRYDFGATAGVELSYRAGKNTFLIDGRYSLGTKDVFAYHPRLGETAVRLRNRTFGVSIGWLFHFEHTPRAPRIFEGMEDDEDEEQQEVPQGPRRDVGN